MPFRDLVDAEIVLAAKNLAIIRLSYYRTAGG